MVLIESLAYRKSVPLPRPLPDDAMKALRELCASTSQAAVAQRLNVSGGTISNALNGRYIGNVERLAERIRGELLNATVCCPVLGEITSRICQDQRVMPLHTANPQRVQIWRACQACSHNPKGKQP